ncbi:hypothetical protein D3C80_2064170 [compost metagenome]
MRLVPDQRLAAIALGETFDAAFPVLTNAFVEVRGHANVEDAERTAGQNVGGDEGAALVHGTSSGGQLDPRVKPEDDDERGRARAAKG